MTSHESVLGCNSTTKKIIRESMTLPALSSTGTRSSDRPFEGGHRGKQAPTC